MLLQGKAARAAARQVARLSTNAKNDVLLALADSLQSDTAEVLAANAADYAAAQAEGLSESLLDRLLLNPDRLQDIAAELRNVASLPDPVGEAIDMKTLPNGMVAGRRRVPLGVVASIYESRPNVTVDIFGLCLKSGNASFLRGGKETIRSNTALIGLIRRALNGAGVTQDAVQFVDNPDRTLVEAMLRMDEYIDLVVPRGGAGLVKFVGENASMPAVTGGVGVCHTYVDRAASLDKAASVAHNAKVRRPSICNALDTLLVHSAVAANGLPLIARELTGSGVELRCDRRALSILGPAAPGPAAPGKVVPAGEDDWGKEFPVPHRGRQDCGLLGRRPGTHRDLRLRSFRGHNHRGLLRRHAFLGRGGRGGRVCERQHPVHRRRAIRPGRRGRNQHPEIPRPGTHGAPGNDLVQVGDHGGWPHQAVGNCSDDVTALARRNPSDTGKSEYPKSPSHTGKSEYPKSPSHRHTGESRYPRGCGGRLLTGTGHYGSRQQQGSRAGGGIGRFFL